MYKNKIGIGLISFNRPNYFKQTLESLEKQENLKNYDFHLFQDGQVNKFSGRIVTDRYLIDRSIRLFKVSKLNNNKNLLNLKILEMH